jgi:hypothetical protein
MRPIWKGKSGVSANAIVARPFFGAILIAGAWSSVLCSDLAAGDRLEIEVREVGGFRRHEPVAALVTLPGAVSRETPFRLLLNGVPETAQFRPAGDDQEAAQWWIDFSTRLAPYEKALYLVEYGGDVRPAAEPTTGHKLKQTKDAYLIENAPYITWTVPRDLAGLLRSVDFPPSEHLRPNSPGLVLRDRVGGRHSLGGTGVQSRVVRSGTRAVALRFTGGFDTGSLTGVRWTTDLVFPSPVSWVEVVCTLEDPKDKVAAMGAELNLALDAPQPDAPTLVDLGAWTMIYTSLSQYDVVEMRAGPGPVTATSDGRVKDGKEAARAGGRCGVFRGKPDQLVPLATNNTDGPDGEVRPSLSAPEGWLHVMDRKRCLALAVDKFAQEAGERLTVAGDGAVRAWREYGEDAAGNALPAKSFRLWLHFVHYPPQYSAATSPRMMQTRPSVRMKAR